MSWHLNTRMLRMLIAVADSPTAAQAASELNITPSALSHQMKQAEASLRVKLFERRSGRAKLTRVGEQVLASVRVIVAELDAAEGCSNAHAEARSRPYGSAADPTRCSGSSCRACTFCHSLCPTWISSLGLRRFRPFAPSLRASWMWRSSVRKSPSEV